MNKRVYPSCREKILDSAEEVVLQHGANHMTLDAVARTAGISKGGLMYHFPSKEKLLEALMRRTLDFWASKVEGHAATLRPGPCLKARTLLSFYFSVVGANCTQQERLFAALAAAKTHQPRLMEIPRKFNTGMLKEFEEEGESLGRSLVVKAALDGIWWSQIFGTYKLNATQQKALRAELQELLEQPLTSSGRKPRGSRKQGKN